MMIVRSNESLETKIMKVQTDIKLLKSCKKNLNSTFAEFNLAIKSGSTKLESRLARIKMEGEMKDKYHETRKLRKEIVAISNQLKVVLGLFISFATH